ncbi:hypothetical protein K469DRAFT_157555 [Zopfia rhizophila CBS 207.26]|uniref:Uncharacterized protein n=1 Tax=Zopfia rhizophila CBS 207.26 TaxID=1314779 RepID=A0A6A6E4C6_9PEZI|nr:hypothetical protein K469DRAFT_157555 [Zopfia rhizophila CBS 207.26]
MKEAKFTIPPAAPPQHSQLFAPHGANLPTSKMDYIRCFTNCAQIKIVEPGGGTPGPLVKFPGAHQLEVKVLCILLESDKDYMKYTTLGPKMCRLRHYGYITQHLIRRVPE